MKKVRAFYTVAELAELTGYTAETVRTMLRRSDIKVLGGGKKGRAIRVPVSEVLHKLDVVFFSHRASESLRKAAE